MKIRTYHGTTASIDVDVQKGFTPICPNELPVIDGHLIVDELNKQASKARYRLFSKDLHPTNAIYFADDKHPQFSTIENSNNADIYWNSHCVSGTVGSELLDGLPKPEEYDFFIAKGFEANLHPYSACYHDLDKTISTGIIEWLKDKNINTILVGGLALDYCVYETALDLRKSGFLVVINKSATKSIGDFNETIEKLIFIGCVIIENSDEIELV